MARAGNKPKGRVVKKTVAGKGRDKPAREPKKPKKAKSLRKPGRPKTIRVFKPVRSVKTKSRWSKPVIKRAKPSLHKFKAIFIAIKGELVELDARVAKLENPVASLKADEEEAA